MMFVNTALAVALAGMANSLPASDPASPPAAAPIPPGTPPIVPLSLDSEIVTALEVLGKSPSDLRLPGSRPAPGKPAGTDLLPGIENIVVVMFENHAYDHMWGMLDRPDADGLPIDPVTGKPTAVNAFENGTLLHSYPMSMTCQRTTGTNSPTQNWGSTHVQMNNGSNDGFVIGNGNLTNGNKTIAMSYVLPEQLPYLHAIGRTFPICDRWFCSVPGQTWANRMYLIAGTSLGITSTDQDLNGTLVPESHSYFTTLNDFNITWRNYVPGFGKPDAKSTLDRFPADNATAHAHGADRDQFFSDAAAGKLPQYSLIDTNGTLDSQEAPQNMVVGDALLFSIVQALGASPQWNKSMLIVTWDEHGGYYDHVPPPVALAPDMVEPIPPPFFFQYDGFKRYGFRVPAVVVSPYSKKNHVVHHVHDHASVLALLQRKWNLPSRTWRDANANDMIDFLDLEALALGRPNFPDISALNLGLPGNTTEALACSDETNPLVPPPEAYQEPSIVFPN
ncbi:phosphoesterase family-domain-containing protein [Xylaria intraflava]|nr:phosphoesterase family-domain-containing protein [Xylaria intraflava]